jgi:hypothetical protein
MIDHCQPVIGPPSPSCGATRRCASNGFPLEQSVAGLRHITAPLDLPTGMKGRGESRSAIVEALDVLEQRNPRDDHVACPSPCTEHLIELTAPEGQVS